MMVEDFDGTDVFDATGKRIGTVEQSYVDDRGAVQFVEVKMGGFRAKHRLVPVAQSQAVDGGLKVPFEKEVIEQSPDASGSNDILQGDILRRASAYYAPQDEEVVETTDEAAVPASTSNTDEGIGGKIRDSVDRMRANLPGGGDDSANEPVSGSQAQGQSIGAVRDLGDVVEVPIVEEELVKRPVVKEVLRVRKNSVGTTQTVNADLRKEDIEVEQDGDFQMRDNSQ